MSQKSDKKRIIDLSEQMIVLFDQPQIEKKLYEKFLQFRDQSKETKMVQKKATEQNELIRILQEENYTLENKVNELQEKLELSREKLKIVESKLEHYDIEFGQIVDLFERYQNIQLKKVNFENTICTRDIFSFLITGSNIDNLGTLWDGIKYFWINEEQSGERFELLRDIFFCFFELNNHFKKEPEYQFLQPKLGEKYDYNNHIRTENSKAQGKIKEVILPGYRNCHTGELIRNPFVVVG